MFDEKAYNSLEMRFNLLKEELHENSWKRDVRAPYKGIEELAMFLRLVGIIYNENLKDVKKIHTSNSRKKVFGIAEFIENLSKSIECLKYFEATKNSSYIKQAQIEFENALNRIKDMED